MSQIGSIEFRNKSATDQKAEVDLLLRLYRDQVSKKVNLRMQNEFQAGKKTGGLSKQISANNPLRNQ